MIGKVIISILLALMVVVGIGNLWSTRNSVSQFKQQFAQQQSQQRASSQQEVARICGSFHKIAILRPPPGNPATNPARAYDQQLHAALASVYNDLECP